MATDRFQSPPPSPGSTPAVARIADVLVHVQCAYTSLERWREFGLIERERPWFAKIAPMFGRVALVTYGGAADIELARGLTPEGCPEFVCIANDRGEEPARFQASVAGRVAEIASATGSAVVFTDQHFGGEVGIAAAGALRARAVRTGLVARGGYHWSWFVARDHGADSMQAAVAAAREGELCRAADVVVGSTRRMTDDLTWRHALPADRCRVIPNFVSSTGFQPVRSAREPFSLLAAGRLEPQKRFDLLVRAVALVAKSHPGVRLTIHGDGSQREPLLRLIAELRAPVEVRARVPQTELLETMRRCAAFVQCSAFEGHPKTIIEALACGAPVVVTRGPGVDDEIVPGVTGVTARDDAESVAAAIRALLDDPAKAAAIGAAAAADVRGQLSLDAVVPMIAEACRDAVVMNGTQATMPGGGVRWDQELLNAAPSDAAGQFAGSIQAFAKRLSPEGREVFFDRLGTDLGTPAVSDSSR